MKWKVLAVLFFSLYYSVGIAQQAPTNIITTLPFLTSLVRALTSAIPNVTVISLVQVEQDEHLSSLTPRQSLSVLHSSLIVFLDKNSQSALHQKIHSVAPAVTRVVLCEIVTCNWIADINKNPDIHLWQDLEQAVPLVSGLEATLLTIFPDHSQKIKQNASQYISTLRTATKKIQNLLVSYKHRAWVTPTGGWKYFARSAGLTDPISLLTHSYHHEAPSAEALLRFQRRVTAERAYCLISDSAVPPPWLERTIKKLPIQYIVAQPIGIRARKYGEANSYPEDLITLAEELARCFSNS
ncbi:MAG: metal ABC transporter substrate-binding protein [Methylacidiphilales bacterium]|nr:metal ABC transporter substrate-binding protein [Candidatus Methylacidiphilales bacterium]